MNVKLNPGTSWYLDVLRGGAAFVVLLGHAGQGFFSQGFPWMPKVAHEMVVIFFVLSGFVMSYVVSRGPSHWQDYLVARFSRIASVAYPALVVTIICDFIGRRIAPDFYAEIARSGGYWERILLSSFCSSQVLWRLVQEVILLSGLWLMKSGIISFLVSGYLFLGNAGEQYYSCWESLWLGRKFCCSSPFGCLVSSLINSPCEMRLGLGFRVSCLL
jgi:hypothetical protein